MLTIELLYKLHRLIISCMHINKITVTFIKDNVTDGLLPLDWNDTSVETVSPSTTVGAAGDENANNSYVVRIHWCKFKDRLLRSLFPSGNVTL